jgi:hypothetical protein
MYQTNDYEGIMAETITIHGLSPGYHQRVLCQAAGSWTLSWHVVLVHHMPGWDDVVSRSLSAVCAPRLSGYMSQTFTSVPDTPRQKMWQPRCGQQVESPTIKQ